jgi:hypothetical protein
MNGEQWLACTSPERMLETLGDQASGRKLRYFLVACARRVLPPSPDEDMVEALATAEQFADGTATRHRLGLARSALKTNHPARVARWDPLYTANIRSVPAWHATREQVVRAAREGANCCAWASTRSYFLGRVAMTYPQEELGAQAGLLRDIFGNPFRPVTVEPSWLTPTVVALAQAAYEERGLPSGHLDPARLAVLADALEEAGAEDTLLVHLRGARPHVRGCHAVDAVLQRS